MRSLKFAIAVVVFAHLYTGCSASDDNYTVTSRGEHQAPVDPRILPYYQMFARAAGQSVPAIRVTIGRLEKGVAGKCYRPGEKAVTNQVGEIFFGDATDPEMRVVISSRYYREHRDNKAAIHQVVFHELGHCLLGRDHDEGWMTTESSEMPKSIMYSRAFGDEPWYPSLISYYEKEMFGRVSGVGSLKLKDAPTPPAHSHTTEGWHCGTDHPAAMDFASQP